MTWPVLLHWRFHQVERQPPLRGRQWLRPAVATATGPSHQDSTRSSNHGGGKSEWMYAGRRDSEGILPRSCFKRTHSHPEGTSNHLRGRHRTPSRFTGIHPSSPETEQVAGGGRKREKDYPEILAVRTNMFIERVIASESIIRKHERVKMFLLERDVSHMVLWNEVYHVIRAMSCKGTRKEASVHDDHSTYEEKFCLMYFSKAALDQ
ncbi:hypothetical protein AVEN_168441-1 [Araneus ventricosus]|uniref:Uncharacterized protein n=1 Tax=Araneus ventricosus TaxID=182803 RepID=A0A4Y2GTI7_ARAVE|nr:hypothetical protein AVEN_168441-1 [Araneus ventricosus]